MKRRLFVATSLAALGGGALAGCASVAKVTNALNDNAQVTKVLGSAQGLNHAIIGTRGSAKVYPDSYVDADFRTNGLQTPADGDYQRAIADNYRNYRLPVDGEVERPQVFTYAHLRAIQNIVQATRHDCVEGWSAVGKFGGVQLGTILAMVKPKSSAKYVVCYSYDKDEQGTPFYGSLSVGEAMHPQTLLALDLNGKTLDPDHGAPVRLKIPTQLGYKSTKWIKHIAFVSSFKDIGGGAGGYWEDQGYEWYAGI